MTDLRIFGKTYSNVAGIKATDTDGNEVVYGGGWTTEGIASNTEPSGNIEVDLTAIADYAFANKPITSIIAPNCVSLGSQPFRATGIKQILPTDFPSLTTFSSFGYSFGEMYQLEKIHLLINTSNTLERLYVCRNDNNLKVARFPLNTQSIGQYCFGSNYALKIADLGNAPSMVNYAFNNARLCEIIIIRSNSVCTIPNTTLFANSPFTGYGGRTGKAYVPSSLISAYESASNWSTLVGNGTCQFIALEGSPYESINFDDSAFLE